MLLTALTISVGIGSVRVEVGFRDSGDDIKSGDEGFKQKKIGRR